MSTLFRRGNVWLTREQLFEYNKKNSIVITKDEEKQEPNIEIQEKEEIVPAYNEDGSETTITQEELENSELVESKPMVEVIKEETDAKSIGTETKKAGKEKAPKQKKS